MCLLALAVSEAAQLANRSLLSEKQVVVLTEACVLRESDRGVKVANCLIILVAVVGSFVIGSTCAWLLRG